jgi:hypothetical protein
MVRTHLHPCRKIHIRTYVCAHIHTHIIHLSIQRDTIWWLYRDVAFQYQCISCHLSAEATTLGERYWPTCNIYPTYLSELLPSAEHRAHNSPHTQSSPNTNITEWNFVYKTWSSYVSTYFLVLALQKLIHQVDTKSAPLWFHKAMDSTCL